MRKQVRKCLLSKAAEQDLLEIARHTNATWGTAKRKAYLSGISQNIRELARNPSLGTACDEVRAGLRFRPQGRHVIFYSFDENCLYVVRVLHDKMDAVMHLIEPGL